MTTIERAELRAIIKNVFNSSLSRDNMFNEIESFINRTYIDSSDGVAALSQSIRRAGSYQKWKSNLIDEIKDQIK